MVVTARGAPQHQAATELDSADQGLPGEGQGEAAPVKEEGSLLQIKGLDGYEQLLSGGGGEVLEQPPWLLKRAKQVLSDLRSLSYQPGINGRHNIWILKPGGKSRGRGIQCFNNLARLQECIQSEPGAQADTSQSRHSQQQWVAQKYVERPLIIHKRKFDIRQWVLVSSWQPLAVWFYARCYVRFCAEDYSPHALDNVYSHLSNNCVAKMSDIYDSQCVGEGNMWHSHQLADDLRRVHGRDVWQQRIEPQMRRIAAWSLLPCQEHMRDRKNSFELYGYDFVLDCDLNVWLLEVNCSPSLEHSTPVTSLLVEAMCADTVQLMLDFPVNRRDALQAVYRACLPEDEPTRTEAPLHASHAKQSYAHSPGNLSQTQQSMLPSNTGARADGSTAGCDLQATKAGTMGVNGCKTSQAQVGDLDVEEGDALHPQFNSTQQHGTATLTEQEAPKQLPTCHQSSPAVSREELPSTGDWQLIYLGPRLGVTNSSRFMANPLLVQGQRFGRSASRSKSVPARVRLQAPAVTRIGEGRMGV